jgi:2-amino-4-hydroxy-6-hydroxymethyldihydropteridine diphosphokinase
MTEVYLALGANVGDPMANIEKAIDLLSDNLYVIKPAPVYSSTAVGYTDQPDFLNTAISGQTDLSPEALFNFIKQVEQKVGRQQRFRNGPREIDIDIIFYGDQVIETPNLTIPHPRFHERDFVLRPLVDLNPQKIDVLSGQTVRTLLDSLPESLINIIKI